jgi:transcriptional regulator GlxA family with amidase domain
MIGSEGDAKAMLEGILSEADGMKGGLGDMFRLVVSTAMQSCPAHGSYPRQVAAPLQRGGLAAWQLRRAQGLMMDALGGQLSVANVARECGLSHSYFSRAFRNSLGVSPHQWLCNQRIERAKWLLINTDQTLLAVASGCGFAEQCHFTRMFTRWVGMTPGVWRRIFGAGSELWGNTSVPERASL